MNTFTNELSPQSLAPDIFVHLSVDKQLDCAHISAALTALQCDFMPSLSYLFIYLFTCLRQVSCSPCRPQTYFVAEDDLELPNSPAFTSQMCEYKQEPACPVLSWGATTGLCMLGKQSVPCGTSTSHVSTSSHQACLLGTLHTTLHNSYRNSCP